MPLFWLARSISDGTRRHALLAGAVPMQPVETGCAPDHPEDALALLRAAGGNFELDQVCPYRFRQPAAPLVAAEAEGKTISIERIERLELAISAEVTCCG